MPDCNPSDCASCSGGCTVGEPVNGPSGDEGNAPTITVQLSAHQVGLIITGASTVLDLGPVHNADALALVELCGNAAAEHEVAVGDTQHSFASECVAAAVFYSKPQAA